VAFYIDVVPSHTVTTTLLPIEGFAWIVDRERSEHHNSKFKTNNLKFDPPDFKSTAQRSESDQAVLYEV
jgi:hypothetical protein